jgi:hypothetical protein
MRKLIIEEIKKNYNQIAKIKGIDQELSDCLRNFEGVLESDQQSIEIPFMLYSIFDGPMKDIAGEALAKSFEHFPNYFIMNYAKKFKAQNCSFILIVPEQWDGALAERAEKIIRLERS